MPRKSTTMVPVQERIAQLATLSPGFAEVAALAQVGLLFLDLIERVGYTKKRHRPERSRRETRPNGPAPAAETL